MCSLLAVLGFSVFTLCLMFNSSVGDNDCCAPQIIFVPSYYPPWFRPPTVPRPDDEISRYSQDNPSVRNFWGPEQFPPSQFPGFPFNHFIDKLKGHNEGPVFPNPITLQGFEESEEDLDSILNHPNWKYFDKESCGETVEDRIIGGTDAKLGQYPWLAVVGYKTPLKPDLPVTYSCGAALINTCWVVSAAHCVHGLPGEFYVYHIRLGEHDLSKTVDCNENECAAPVQDIVPSKIIYNTEFNHPKLQNDISLIKLSKPAEYNKWVSPICLPYGDLITKDLVGQIAEVAGWGISNIKTNETSQVLQTVKLPIVPNSQCAHAFRKKAKIVETQVCVGGKVGKDSCNGDSGGPLMKVDVANDGSPKYYIFGAVSFGVNQCGIRPLPAVYTRISGFLEWILDHVSKC